MTSFDVAVIGAGMIGASAALALAGAGRSVALIGPGEPADRTAHAGPFASHYDEGRITRIADPDPLWAAWAAESIARYGEIEARSGIRFHHPVGTIRAAPRGSASLQAAAASVAPYGVHLEEIDGTELARRCPATGLSGDMTVLWEPAPAGYVNPRRMVAVLKAVAGQSGAVLLPEEAVSLSASGDGAGITLAGGGHIACARALVAVGPHALDRRLLPMRPDLQPFGRTVVQFEVTPGDPAFAGLPAFVAAFDAGEADYSFYGVPPVAYPGGGVWLKTGGGPMSDRLDGADSVRAHFHAGGAAAEARIVRDMTLRMFPGLAAARWRTEPCAIVETATGRPFIGRVPGQEAVGVALGCNGLAAKSCIAIGRVAADMIADEGWGDSEDARPLAPRWRG